MNRLSKLLLALLVLALVAVGTLVVLRDRALAALIETVGTEATGQQTEVASVSTGLLSGELGLDSLTVANPQGFSEEPFLRLGALALAVPYAALSEDPLRVELVEVEGLALRLERRGTDLNYQPILESLEEGAGTGDDSGGDGDQKASEDEDEAAGPGRTVIIDRVRIADWRLVLDVGRPVVGPQELAMGELVIEDLQVSGEGALNDAVGRVLLELIEAGLDQAAELPAELAPIVDALRGALADGAHLEDLDAVLNEAVEQAEALVEETGAALGQAAQQKAGEELGNALDKAKEELGDDAAPIVDEAAKQLGKLLGGKQKQDDGQ